MSHGPATEWKIEKHAGFKTKLGLYMFAAYAIIYLAFMFLCVFAPKFMGMETGPLNVAISFGFGLIILAVIQALVYNYICSKNERKEQEEEEEKKS